MNEVQKWAAVVCLAALAGAVVELLIPPGKLEQTVRFVLGAFLLCAILTPFLSMAKGIQLNWDRGSALSQSSASSFSEKVDGQMQDAMKQQLEALIRQSLQESGISPGKIEIFMDTDDQGRILITRLTVHLPQEEAEKRGQAKQILEEKLEMSVEIATDKR